MKRVGLVIGLITSIMLLIPTDAYAQAGAPDILIVELQVRGSGTTGAADQEFAELYNVTKLPIDMSSWKLQYKSATGTTWSDKVTLHGILASHSRFLLVSDKFTGTPTTGTDGSPLGIDTFSAGFSDSAGHIRIINNTIPTVPDVHDTLGWGTTANAAEGNAPATAPGGGKSLKRNVDADGNFVDTNNNAADFALSTEPSPQADPLYIVPPVDETPPPDPALEPDPNPAPDPIQTPPPASEDPAVEQPATEPETPAPSPVLPPQISELLPNPAAPASDSTDEFIELYNPNEEPLELSGYKLQSGMNSSYSYTFPAVSLGAHEYKAFYVSETGDVLSNSSGQARLLDPAGTIVAQTDAYDSADDGDAWAFVNGAWQWTTTPTPGAANLLTLPILKVAATKPVATKKTAANAKTSTAKTTTPKTTAAKVAAAKTAKPATAAAERQVYEDPATTPTSIHPGILAGVGAITLLYAAYEYRYDVINRLHRFRRYRAVRREARTEP